MNGAEPAPRPSWLGGAPGAGSDRVDDDLIWKIGLYSVGSLFRACFDLRPHDGHNLPSAGSALVAANHISVLDAVGIAAACSDRGRTVRFLVATEVLDVPVVGRGLRAIRQIPIQRGTSWAAIEEAAAVIRQGGLAGIFPEGHIGPGELQRVEKGAARLALAAGVPVVPVGIWGTQVRWPKSGLTFRGPARPIAAIVFAPPIATEGDPRSARDVRALTKQVATSIAGAVDDARRLAAPDARTRGR